MKGTQITESNNDGNRGQFIPLPVDFMIALLMMGTFEHIAAITC